MVLRRRGKGVPRPSALPARADRSLAEIVAEMVRRDPDRAGTAVELGMIDRAWLEGDRPMSAAPPREVLERFLERSVERRPSILASLGLDALRYLESTRTTETGDTKPVTVMFADLVGFASFTAEQGDEAAARLLGDHRKAVGPVIRSRGGRIVKQFGDGFLLLFPEPEPAVRAALELRAPPSAPLDLRAGLHLGEAIVTPTDVCGNVVNVAARVTESAKGSQILLTSAVRDAAGELTGIEFQPAQRRRLKGIANSVELFEARSARI